jgi:hypothetical protein
MASSGDATVVVKKILAVIAMVLCAGVLLACLAGAIGVWVARAPLTNTAVALLTTAYDTLQKVETTAGQVSQGLGELQGLAGKLDDAVNGVSAAAGVLKQIGPVGDALNAITGGVQQLDGKLAEIQASAGDIRSQAGGLASTVDVVRQRIPVWINVGAFAITLALLWIGLGQVSLFIHALAWFRGGTPGLRQAQTAPAEPVEPVTTAAVTGQPDAPVPDAETTSYR